MHFDSLGDVIRINAETYPDRLAFECEGETRTFAQFNSRVNQLVDALYARGLVKSDRIGLLSSNRIEMVEGYGAAEKGGFIAVPLNFKLSTAELAYLVENSGMRAVIAEGRYLAILEGISGPKVYVFRPEGAQTASYEELVASGDRSEPAVRADPSDVAYMMYTGGTTGRPKGVLLDHCGQMANAKCTLIDATVEPQDTLLTVMPLHHIGGKNFATVHFHRACTNILIPTFNAATVLNALSKRNVRCALLAPTMIKMLLDELKGAPPPALNLKTIYYSSAPMPGPLLREAIKAFGRVFVQFYGLTESGPSGVMLRKEDHQPDGTPAQQERLAAAGRPQIYNQVRVVDDEGKDVGPGEVGEVIIGGQQVMKGYWNNPDATKATLRDGWIYSGDLGRIDAHGYLFIVGRKKDVIISGGENIYPREIEEVLHAHPAILEAAVVGAPDPKWGEAVTAVIVLRVGAALSEQETIQYCEEKLARFKKPKAVYFRQALPRSSLGKILKNEIRDEFWKDQDRKV
jgi:acyl-CoA synthetase (AMP-forming)/AMP-acid ligase II